MLCSRLMTFILEELEGDASSAATPSERVMLPGGDPRRGWTPPGRGDELLKASMQQDGPVQGN